MAQAARSPVAPARQDAEPATRTGIVFPHAVCRTAGLPAGAVDDLRAPDTLEALAAAREHEARAEALREPLCEALHAAVGDAAERPALRRKLLQVRRDVHNQRRFDRSRLAALAGAEPPALAPELAADLETWLAELVAAERARAEAEAAYERELAASRRALQRHVGDADFQKALLLSSRSLAANLERYRGTRVEELTAKERQVERGLLRYFTRMVLKTTPFGTFTALAPARLLDAGDPGGAGLPRFAGDPRAKRSVVRLNKRIYAHLLRELLDDEAVRARVAVELNPTLAREDGRWRFLAQAGGKEVFQRLAASPVVDLYQELLAAGPLPRGELEARLAGHPAVAAGAEEVAAFTSRLVEIGLLRPRTGIPPQEAEWDRPLAALLAAAGSRQARRAADFLTALREGCDGFATAPLGRRRELLEAAAERIRTDYEILTRRHPLRADVPFYEDAGTAAVLELPRRELAPALDELVDYVRLTARLAWPRHEAAAMRHFFDRRYRRDERVPLLRFYEEYHREHFKEHLDLQRRVQAGQPLPADGPSGDEADGGGGGGEEAEVPRFDALNPFHLPMVERIKAANDGITRTLHERWLASPDAAVLALGRDELAAAVEEIPAPGGPWHSYSLFVHVLPGEAPDGGPALLVSSVLRGFGKYFSRFLDVLPDDVGEALYRLNASAPDALLAEISGDGDFNANLHPPLVPWEISYPTGEPGPVEGRLPAADLVLAPAPDDPHALALVHAPSGRRVVPLDLGFLNPTMRPPLFQLLSNLGPAANFMFQAPELPSTAGPAAADGGEDEAVVHRPRLMVGDRLIVGRRRWTVPSEHFPRREAGAGAPAYFAGLDAWRRRHGLPEQVFFAVRPRPGAAVGGGSAAGDGGEPPRPRRGDLYKPQLLDFASPLLVDLAERLLAGLEGQLVHFYERLPAPRHLAAAGARRYATELVMQVDFPGGFAAAATPGGGLGL